MPGKIIVAVRNGFMNCKILYEVVRKYPPKIWLISYLTDATHVEYRDTKHYIRGRLVDIGCGAKPYKDFWASVVSEHIGVDHQLLFMTGPI